LRTAVLSDIHGNLTAFEAVLAHIKHKSPDLVLHGGDLADAGSSPIEIVDRIRQLGWHGVRGNSDEMLFRPDSLEDFARQSLAPTALWTAIREIAATTRSVLGQERLAWLGEQPLINTQDAFTLVHATPESCWRAPADEATDVELQTIYGPLDRSITVFGHTHRPFIRHLAGRPRLIINTGSVGLPYDGDPRASYLLLEGNSPSIQRVDYDLEKELKALSTCGLPGAAWTARMLRTGSPQMP
jgi:putative phosphoesterase